jgi:small subunit ribosomal protein S21
MNQSNFKKKSKPFKGMKGGDFSPAKVVSSISSESGKFSHIQPVQAKPLEVIVYGNNLEKAIRLFRTKVQKERIIALYKEKQSYEKPSDKKRRKRGEMKRKLLELDKPEFIKKDKIIQE